MLLMDGLRENLDTIDERLKVYQRCKDIEQEWYGNDKVLYDMMEVASNNNFVELLASNDDMSTNYLFHERSCENNTMEEPSAVEEPTILKMHMKHLLLQLVWLMIKQ